MIKPRLRAVLKIMVGSAAAVLALACPAYAPAAPAPPLDHAGRWITDADGRVVILHGWNMVYKVGSYRPEDAGFGDDDAQFLADNGFNTVRLGVIYKGVEPTAGTYEDAYLDSIARTESTLAAHGIFSLLDFHQDLYNERFQGEGLPDWAVVGDAATLPAEPQVGFPGNYLEMPALNRAFDHFWLNDMAADGRTLQDAYASAWRHVAGRFADKAHVLGYNLFNEPWPGSQYPSCTSTVGCPVFDQQLLQPFSERVIAAIRQADPSTLAWYAPLLTFDFGADTSHGDTGDSHAGFAFNMYCLAELGGAVADLGPATGPECDTGYGLTLDNAEQQSAETGDALLMTEFAATNKLEIVKRVIDLADERMISWQQWHYCACDDPTTSGPGVQAVVGDASEPPTGANVDEAKLLVSSRPYPQAVSGTPEGYGFDDQTKEFHLDYSTARADASGNFPAGSRTEIFVPELHYPDGYAVDVQGAQVTSAPGASLLTLESCGTGPVAVRVTPTGGPPESCPYEHPASAPSVAVALVPAFAQCGTGGNPASGQHSPPLSVGSCAPQSSSAGVSAGAGFTGTASVDVRPDSSDVDLSAQLDDVRAGPSATGSPYEGGLDMLFRARSTDRQSCTGSGCSGPYDQAATATDFDIGPVQLSCTAGSCSGTSSIEALSPGTVVPGGEAVMQVFRIRVNEAPGGALFAQQGVFAP